MTDEQMDDIKHFFETTMDNKLRPIEDRLDGIDGRLDGIDGRLDGIDGRLDGLEQRVGSIEQRLEEAAEVQNQILNAVGERFDDHEARITKLESKGGGKLKLRPAA